MWVWGGMFGQMTDPEALLLQGRGYNSSAGGLQLKTQSIYQSLGTWGGVRSKEHRGERKDWRWRGRGWAWGRRRRGSPFGRAPCHFPSWPPRLTSSYLSSIYNLFSVRSSWPDLTPTLPPRASSLLSSLLFYFVSIASPSLTPPNLCCHVSSTLPLLLFSVYFGFNKHRGECSVMV